MNDILLPQELSDFIGSEKKDFIVKASHFQPLKKSIGGIFFGTVFLAFSSMFVFTFLGPLFVGKEVHFTSNGVQTVASPDNLGPIIMPSIIIGIFVLIGLIVLLRNIYLLLKKGGYFVATPTRLINFQNGNIKSIDWEQFSGYIEVNGNNQNGNIHLQMRTGRMVSRRNGPSRYVPDFVYIIGIQNVYDIEKICSKRIKENDPTPSVNGI